MGCLVPGDGLPEDVAMAWSTADFIIFAIASYLAVVTLVRLMRARRDELVADVHRQIQSEKRRRKKPRKTEQPREEAA